MPLLIKQNKGVRYKSFSLPPYYRHITAKLLSIVLESLRHLSPTSHRHLLPTFTSRNGRINFITKSSNSLVFRDFAFRHITDICYRQVSDIVSDIYTDILR